MENGALQAKPQPNSSESLKLIVKALEYAALMRAGKMGKEDLRAYSLKLNREPTEDVILALEKLSEMPRQEYERAIPDLGAMLALVKVCTLARQNRSADTRSERLVRWQCPSCKATQSGFPKSSDDLFRKCYKPIRDPRGERMECGAMMTVVFDDAAPKSNDYIPWEAA